MRIQTQRMQTVAAAVLIVCVVRVVGFAAGNSQSLPQSLRTQSNEVLKELVQERSSNNGSHANHDEHTCEDSECTQHPSTSRSSSSLEETVLEQYAGAGSLICLYSRKLATLTMINMCGHGCHWQHWLIFPLPMKRHFKSCWNSAGTRKLLEMRSHCTSSVEIRVKFYCRWCVPPP